MPKAEKYPNKLDKLFTPQNIANLQGIGFKIYRDLTKPAPFQFRLMRCICLNKKKKKQTLRQNKVANPEKYTQQKTLRVTTLPNL